MMGSWQRSATLTCLVGALLASEAGDGHVFISFDNDVVVGKDSDYTNGFSLGWLSSTTTTWEEQRGFAWAGDLLQVVPFIHAPQAQKAVSLDLMQAMYTPVDLTLDPPDPNDRPYCGVSMLTLGIHQLDQRSLIGLDLSLGVTGDWSLAGDTQTWIHDQIDAAEPQGWDYQIGNSILLNLALEHRWRLTTIGHPYEHFGSDLLVGYTGMLGNFRTSLIGDIGMRVGYRMTSAYGTLSTRPGSEGRLIPPTHASSWGVHVGVTLAGEAVAYDVTLDGRLFHDDHVQVDREPFLARLGMVFGAHFGNLQLFVLLVESTDAFEGEEKRPSYGRFIATWTF